MGYPRIRRILIKRLEKTLILAWDPDNRRHVVVKRFSNLGRALREGSAMASYGNNPHMIRLLKAFRTPRFVYLVMEYAKGPTLKKLIRRQGTLGVNKTINLALKILAGIDALHQRGYVHGDLHSGNVLVTSLKRGSIKIIDFEHAVKKDESGKAKASRRLSKVPANLAPETRTGIIDDTYDIYSVGCMCAEMLRGKPSRKPPRKLSGPTEAALWKVIRKAMHPNPRKRYQSAREMMAALMRVQALQKPGPSRPSDTREKPSRKASPAPASWPAAASWPGYWPEQADPDTARPPASRGKWERSRVWPTRDSTKLRETPAGEIDS